MNRRLTTFSIAMMNIIAVDSLRSLPFSAEYGLSLVFFYLFACITFLIPTGLAAAELATGFPEKGGIYIWVKEAFGKRAGLLIIWLQWIYNVVWYPTILSFLASAIAYVFMPSLAKNSTYLVSMVVTLFWLSTFLNLQGVNVSSRFYTFGALFGTLVPMTFISILGMAWIIMGNPIAIDISANSILPSKAAWGDISFYITLLFGLMGMEMSAVHAEEVDQPKVVYPRAILISSTIIIFSLIFSSLAIAVVVPKSELSVISGLFQAYELLLGHYNLAFLAPVFDMCIVLGALANLSAWILGPSKGLMVAMRYTSLSKPFGQQSESGAPRAILIFQGLLVTALSILFLIFDSVSSSYWILSVITGELALFVYVGLFLAFIKLRFSHSHIKRTFLIPGKTVGAVLLGGLGLLACLSGCIAGLVPPKVLENLPIYGYLPLVIGGVFLFTIPPFFLKLKNDIHE